MSGRRIRHIANCRGRMVWENSSSGASRNRYRNGVESPSKALRSFTGFLSRIPLRLTSCSTQKYNHNLRRSIRDGRILRIFTRVCPSR